MGISYGPRVSGISGVNDIPDVGHNQFVGALRSSFRKLRSNFIRQHEITV